MARIAPGKSSGGPTPGSSGPVAVNGEVVLKGDAKQLDATLVSTSKNLNDVTEKLAAVAGAEEKAKGAADRYRAAREAANATTVKAASASTDLTKTYNRLGFAAHQVVAGTANFNTALQGVLGTLGPIGVAVGAVVGVVWHFVDAEMAAAEATKKTTIELQKQRAEAAKQSKIDYYNTKVKPAQLRAAEERSGIKALRETEDYLEEEAARARREVRFADKGSDTAIAKQQLSEVVTARARARAEVLKAEAQIARAVDDTTESIKLEAEAERVMRGDTLRLIDEEDKAEEEKHQKQKKRNADELTDDEKSFKRRIEQLRYREQLFAEMSERVAGYTKRDREARDAADFKLLDQKFEMAAARSEQMQRAARSAELERLRAQNAAGSIQDPALAGIEQQRIDEQFRFSQELEIAFGQAEQSRQIRHLREMQRLDEERAAREKMLALVEKGTKIAASAASQTLLAVLSVSDARRQAERAARAQGKTEAEAAHAGKIAELGARASQLQGIRNMAGVKAIEQTAEGLAALASFNYPGAALHFAAAGVFGAVAGAAGVRSNSLSDRAAGLDGGGAFGGGSGFGPSAGRGSSGYGGAANNGGSANTGPIPGSPTSQPRQGTAGGGTTNVVHINGPVYGKVDRDFARGVFEQGRELGYTGRTGGG